MRDGARSTLIDLVVQIERETAVGVVIDDGTKKVWLPKSQIEIERDQPKLGMAKIALPEWLAMDKGLI